MKYKQLKHKHKNLKNYMKNLFNLEGKTALITGGGGLLGPKHAEAIIEYGGKVILTDHHLDRVEEKSKILNDKYGSNSCTFYYMDVTDPQSIESVINNIE